MDKVFVLYMIVDELGSTFSSNSSTDIRGIFTTFDRAVDCMDHLSELSMQENNPLLKVSFEIKEWELNIPL